MQDVIDSIHSAMPINIHVVDARDRFFSALKGITDPEEKRKRCGHLFIEVFEEEASRHGQVSG